MEPLELFRQVATRTDSKIVVLIMDGLGGAPGPEGRSELEVAHTPNLDQLASRSNCGLADPVIKGVTPGSGPGHLAIFGYDPLVWEIGRGVLEALGTGFELEPDDVAARGNFVTLDEQGHIVDRRAGRIPHQEGERLCQLLQEHINEIDGVRVFVRVSKEYRFVLVLRGQGLGADVEDSDPQRVGVPPKRVKGRDEASERTAAVVNKFVTLAGEILRNERPANGVVLRGFAKRPAMPTFQELYQLTPAAIATYPMYRGLARLAGMEIIQTPAEEDLEALVRLLREHYDAHDYFYVHVKKTDSHGEDGNFPGKVSVIERVDRIIIPALLDLQPDVLAITGDHSTPCMLASHSWHPVPYLLHAKTLTPDGLTGFNERAFARGSLGRFRLVEGMGLLLAHAGKLIKYGA
ncbi:MAG: 2,3-bisphosphoglycerate-independent phosphoglycerate mutase [Acidobacteria bacterium]|nr:MAG: 2,3-bisphosphoglycerate-independent phosphoglycerate mutase [Acidobacteriota bacterium]